MNSRFAAITILLALSAAAAGQSNPMEQGLTLFRRGEYGAALQEFQSASRIQPKNAVIENLIGITETKLGRIQEANADYLRAIRLNPAIEAPHKNLGFNYLNSNDYARAETEFNKALALDPNDTFANYYLVITYLKTARRDAAIAHLKPAESLVASDADTAFAMAVVCLQANASCDGLNVMDAVERRSGFSPAQEFQLAELLTSRQKYAQAIVIFRHLATEQPESWIAKYNLAVALFEAGQAADAVPVLEQAVQERPADTRVLSLLGNVYESAGKLPQALDAYRRAVAADPGNEDIYLDYTRLLMDLDRYDDAIALIRQGFQNAHDAYALNIRLGAIELMQGSSHEAETAFQKAIAENPEVAIGYVALAKAYMQEGRDQAAQDVLSSARKKLPLDFALEYVFGLASARLGNLKEAIQALTDAEKIDPAMVEPHYELGKIYMSSGNWAQAQKELEQVIALNPEHAQARFQLSRIYTHLGDVKKAREMQTQTAQLMNEQRTAALDAQRKRLSIDHPVH